MNEAQYLFGPAGWSYRDWHGPVYPVEKPKNFDALRYVSENFDFVEVNTSFYHIPSPKLTTGWVQKTQDREHFKFWIKLYQNFTHKLTLIKDEVEPFKKALEPLVNASKLEGLLAQFPYSFKLNSDNLNYLLTLPRAFGGFPLAIEFRHNSWNRREVFDTLREHHMIWVNIDQPVISESLPLMAVSTNDGVSYVRLHGRNYGTWFANKGRDERYNYDYKEMELDEIAETVRMLSKLVKKVFISGNNHYKGSAVKNLIELKKLLTIEK
ncbi:MAG TPA: DUF72 domain-containing protein [Candidatus Deferrimicrobium sp.]|nr:DUF72 domain-containing protein [Candidatus Deferrimicrobium sp.]